MEKPWKIKARILAFLPKAATPVTFQVSPPVSPVVKPGARKIPMIPKEARRKPKNSSFEQKEPASPKVSCMGQVKKKKNSKRKPKLILQTPAIVEDEKEKEKEKKKKKVPFMKIFKGDKKVDAAAETDDVHNNVPAGIVERVPSLGQIKKYASGHGCALENFDWRICEEEGGGGGGKVIIPHVGAVEPKKEVNLWKRRNKNPPIPLQI